MSITTSMTRDVIVVSPEQLLAKAWQIMSTEHVRHLPVVRAGALVGMLSDRDVLRHMHCRADGVSVVPHDVTVNSAMTHPPLETCDVSATVAQVARTMIEQKIDAVPVVRGLHLVGLVTSTDLLRLLLRDDEARALPYNFRLIEGGQAHAFAQ